MTTQPTLTSVDTTSLAISIIVANSATNVVAIPTNVIAPPLIIPQISLSTRTTVSTQTQTQISVSTSVRMVYSTSVRIVTQIVESTGGVVAGGGTDTGTDTRIGETMITTSSTGTNTATELAQTGVTETYTGVAVTSTQKSGGRRTRGLRRKGRIGGVLLVGLVVVCLVNGMV